MFVRAGAGLVVAHRGATSGGPENTLAAFEAAIGVGADAVELDVRRTADERFVAFHDERLGRVPLARLTLAEVRRGSPQGTAPLLDEVAELAVGRVRLDVELKEPGYEAQVVERLRTSLSTDEFVVTSFSERALLAVKAHARGVETGLLLGRGGPGRHLRRHVRDAFPLRRFRACGADFLAPHFRLADATVLRQAARAGAPVLVWTVNAEADVSRFLRDPRVAGVITDEPALAVRVRAAATERGRRAGRGV